MVNFRNNAETRKANLWRGTRGPATDYRARLAGLKWTPGVQHAEFTVPDPEGLARLGENAWQNPPPQRGK
jgi:hypothetical protein